jgi:hypothetical protein
MSVFILIGYCTFIAINRTNDVINQLGEVGINIQFYCVIFFFIDLGKRNLLKSKVWIIPENGFSLQSAVAIM